MKKTSYALGMNIGANLKQTGAEGIDHEELARGLRHVLEGAPTELTHEEAGELLSQFFGSLETRQNDRAKKEGEEFLRANARQPNVTTLPSGLQYTVLAEGHGPKPKATDKVRCHYQGELINGTVFDSSIQRGTPADFPVNGVIAGWVEALQLMAVGSKWRLFIPYNLAYGERGAGNSIPPFATLIFDVELLDIL